MRYILILAWSVRYYLSTNLSRFILGGTDRPNWQDWGGRWARHTAFMRNLKTLLEELDVKYMKPIQPVLLPKGTIGNRGLQEGSPIPPIISKVHSP